MGEALDARNALALSLAVADIELPAIDVRTPWAEVGEHPQPALVHLGVCSPAVARALADVIRKGATP
ncbi:hypothetical protein LZF96_09325 [Streptomyces sp. ST2-7A]|nr:hypothetical protein [Streptomyces sp. ST2-7A]